MPATRLAARPAAKPWGRRRLLPGFDDIASEQEPIGVIDFDDPAERAIDLGVKYIFTSERLSIQVHPARRNGGKDKAWVVLAADPHATVALGTRSPMTRDELRAAAADGSIEDDMFWRPVKSGDVFYAPAGTLHAIGEGVSLVEIAERTGRACRLYDYDRASELQVEEGVAAADPVPYVAPHVPCDKGGGRTVLTCGPAFVLERWSGARKTVVKAGEGRPIWLIPISGAGTIDGAPLAPGDAWLVEGDATVDVDAATNILVAYAGNEAI